MPQPTEKPERSNFTLRNIDRKHLERIQEHLQSEGHDGTASAAVRYALFRVATALGPPKRKEREQTAAE